MSAGKQRWPREAAEAVADELMAALEPHCETLLVCGSIRRLRPTVGDIELVFIPRTGTKPDPADLFGQPIPADFAADKVNNLVSEGVISKRVRTDGALTWGAQNKLAVHNESKIPVDFYTATKENLACLTVCRTGTAEFNTLVADIAVSRGRRWDPYSPGFYDRVTGSLLLRCATEEEVLRAVGLEWIEPWDRTPETADRLRKERLWR